MDVESFYQCLSYVQLVRQESDASPYSELLIPLAGVVVGFVLSALASFFGAYWKDWRIKRSILSEVKLVKSQAEKTFKATVEMAYGVRSSPSKVTSYQPSATISIFLFKQLFSSVAHRFKISQSEQFQYMQAHVNAVNDAVNWLTSVGSSSRGGEFWDRVYKLIADSARLVDCCDSVLKSASGSTISAFDLAERLGVQSAAITSVLGSRE